MRSVTMDDLHTATVLFNTASRWLTGGDMATVEDIRAEWESPYINLPTDTMACFLPEGNPVAYAEFWDQKEPHVNYIGWVSVHPDYQESGLDEQLMAWLAMRARENMDKAPEGARVTLQRSIVSNQTCAKESLASFGFEQVRTYYRMQITLDARPPEPVLPDGIVIRSISGQEEQRAAIYAHYDSFKDHFGHTDEPFEAFYQRRMYFVESDPHHDPSLWFIAQAGDEIAGVSLCSPFISEDPDQGWVGILGVRRPWRKRGLGLALLHHSFAEFYRRGKPRVGLGVDASSLTGATRLYERAGMRVTRHYDLYELELRPGYELARRELEEHASA